MSWVAHDKHQPSLCAFPAGAGACAVTAWAAADLPAIQTGSCHCFSIVRGLLPCKAYAPMGTGAAQQ